MVTVCVEGGPDPDDDNVCVSGGDPGGDSVCVCGGGVLMLTLW